MELDYTKMSPEEQLAYATHLRSSSRDPALKRKEKTIQAKVITGAKPSTSSLISDLA